MKRSLQPRPCHSGSVSRRAVLRALAGTALSLPGVARASAASSLWGPGQTAAARNQSAPFRRAGYYAAKHQQAA